MIYSRAVLLLHLHVLHIIDVDDHHTTSRQDSSWQRFNENEIGIKKLKYLSRFQDCLGSSYDVRPEPRETCTRQEWPL